MKIRFSDAAALATAPLIVRLVNQDRLPADVDQVIVEGARLARFSGKAGQLHDGFIARDEGVLRLALAGLGPSDAADRDSAVEKAGAGLAARFLTSGVTSMVIDFARSGLTAGQAAALLLAARLRGWRWDAWRTTLKDEQKPSLAEIVAVNAPAGTDTAWVDAAALADGIALTRELVTEPANVLYPESFVERCQARFAGTGIEMSVLGEPEMRELGMGALLGVSQGSARPPRLLALRWNGGAQGEAPVAFVGKGVTFDTGGISLKPAAGMEDMKWDMGGAAAVAGAMLALAGRKAKANVVGVCGLVENMPDALAQRPGDVVISMSGQTIEVINTDAEGRLVLCDALT